MLLSKYFSKTTKEVPAEAELKSHKLLLRGGYVRRVSAGIFSYMPIAQRVLLKINRVLREEMDAVDGYEVSLPVTMPAALWSETGRYEAIGPEMLRFEDRAGRKMLLGMTHEEAVTDLARGAVNSYKQLPFMLYQIQTKFRDEPRVRGGLIRVREFHMKDAYSFHTSQEDLDKYYDRVLDAYFKIFKRCGLPVIAVASDVGMMGGTGAHEFMAVTEAGEDTLVLCTKCDYKANREVAKTKREYLSEAARPAEDVPTPGKKSIEDVARFMGVDQKQTLKTLVYHADGKLVMCVIRGDLEVNETKLRNHLKAKVLQLAEDRELAGAGVVVGFASPVGSSLRLVVDESAARSSNLVMGGNKVDLHVRNANFGRDYKSDDVVDIASVREGEPCIKCGAALKVVRGIEAGNIFKLGVKYSSAMKATFLDEAGKSKDIIMGCYGIGVGRLLASVLETSATETRVIWPISIAPFEVALLGLGAENEAPLRELADKLYGSLKKAGVEVLYDERPASPGIKFKDADLIGAPIRVSVGSKAMAKGGVELTIKDQPAVIVSPDTLIDEVLKARTKLYDELNGT